MGELSTGITGVNHPKGINGGTGPRGGVGSVEWLEVDVFEVDFVAFALEADGALLQLGSAGGDRSSVHFDGN